jgi:hypothetical protein
MVRTSDSGYADLGVNAFLVILKEGNHGISNVVDLIASSWD